MTSKGLTAWLRCAPIAAALALLAAGAARAAPEEIQVYMDELNKPGQFGLDLHLNDTPTGDQTPDYAGQQDSIGRFRLTPEFSYGLTPNLEFGAYLPLTTLDRHGAFIVDGEKVRLKFLAPRAQGQAWFWGANLEIGYEQHRLDANPWNGELKGIVGWRSGRWTVAFNINDDFKISGPEPSPASLDIDTKISWQASKDLAFGLETYNGMGPFAHLGRLQAQDQSTFAVVDKSFGAWDVNFGVGHGYGGSKDGLVIKAVVSVPIDGE